MILKLNRTKQQNKRHPFISISGGQNVHKEDGVIVILLSVMSVEQFTERRYCCPIMQCVDF